MKRYRIPIAAALILLPVLIRTIWFYQGIFWRSHKIATPEYETFSIPQPPLSTPLPAAVDEPTSAIILVDEAHGNMFAPAELDSLTGLLQSRGARVESVIQGSYEDRSLSDQLKYATAYVTVCPIYSYSTLEIQLLEDFVRRGGRLLILTDPTRSAIVYDYYGYGSATVTADVVAANGLLASFDIAFLDDYLYNMTEYEGNYRNVYFRSFADHPLTQDLSTVVLYAAHSLQTPTGTVLIQSSRTAKSSRTDSDGIYPVAALDATSSVLAIGDMTFLQPPYNQVADNTVLIRNLADFLLTAPRIRELKDFPFLFRREVAIVPLDDIALSSSLLGPIQALQRDLAGVGIPSRVAPAPDSAADLILLGTFSSSGIDTYLSSLGIRLPSLSPFSTYGSYPQIEIPGFGSVPSYGIGLILLTRSGDQTILLLLAEDSTSLSVLMDVIGPEGFSDCVLQGDVAVCGLGGGFDDFGDSWWQAFEDLDLTEPAVNGSEP